jgi:hypothetical protein
MKVKINNMNNAHLKQIKIFKLSDYFTKDDLEKDVNDYVVKIFKEQGNYPNIETNSQFISIITDCHFKIG